MSLFDFKQIYKVSEVTKIIKSILESSPISNLWIEGEVSNFTSHPSGHLYFTLKDQDSQISCVIFKYAAERIKFIPEDGISVVLYGKLTVYEPRGNYQIIGTRVEPLGLGALQLAFEQLKQKLAEEGLFDLAHKKPIPLVPRRIGIITSPSGAAIRDMLSIIGKRFYNISILIHPVTVQGENAPKEIADAIKTMNKIGNLDVIIIGRGGGSIEDLWAFNEEVVARSIYESQIPIISAVGHEIDFTIADFVADLRAPTPSAAAEMVVAKKAELFNTLYNYNSRMNAAIRNILNSYQIRFERNLRKLLSLDSRNRIHTYQQTIDYLLIRAKNAISKTIEQKKSRLNFCKERLTLIGLNTKVLETRQKVNNMQQRIISGMKLYLSFFYDKLVTLNARLNALSPLSVLQRGYSISFLRNRIIRSISEISIGDIIEVRLKDGIIISEVKDKEEKNV